MIIFLTVTSGLLFICRFDRHFAQGGLKRFLAAGGLTVLKILCSVNSAVLLLFLTALTKSPLHVSAKNATEEIVSGCAVYAMLSLFAGCLLLACITDNEEFLVYRFIWWIAGAAGSILFWLSANTGKITGLLLFWVLQQFFFSKMYGRGDCHAFCACALVECAFGMSMLEYLIHMLAAFVLLAAIQAVRKNINKRGNLKMPVAFLPYITVSFWMIFLLQKKLCIFIQK